MLLKQTATEPAIEDSADIDTAAQKSEMSDDSLLQDASASSNTQGVAANPVGNNDTASDNTDITPEIVEPETVIIPPGTVIKTFLDEEMSSKNTQPNDEFSVTVAEDIMVGDKIAIPAGAKGFGVVLFANDRGAFGRAGLLDVKVDVIEVGEYDIPVRGRFRQQGKGNAGATVATWMAVGIFSGFITGKEGVMPQGQELKTKILSAIEVPVFVPSSALAADDKQTAEPILDSAADDIAPDDADESAEVMPPSNAPSDTSLSQDDAEQSLSDDTAETEADN